MYGRVTTTRKDGSDRQDRLYKTWSMILDHSRNNAEQCCGCPKRPPHSIARKPLQDATMRSGRPTQAIAGSNDEVGRTADPPSS